MKCFYYYDDRQEYGVTKRLWDQYQSEDSVKTCSRPTTSYNKDRFLTLSARRRRTTTSSLQTTFKHQKESPLLRCEIVGLYARRPVVCVPLNRRQRRNCLCYVSLEATMGFCAVQDESRFTMDSDSGRLLIWREQRTRYHQSNTVERHSYRGGSWFGQGSRTLTCMCSMEET
ncbi:HTH_Tnp_Tc3_2 domain-containing protein [Trichonephila clavipes]|nr:HTH_Tnp_Tc3_2 domain-containing protein [Trichonephila clavipes]